MDRDPREPGVVCSRLGLVNTAASSGHDEESRMLAESVEARLRRSAFAGDAWRTYGEMGWIGAAVAESAGGLGGPARYNLIIARAFGRALGTHSLVGSAVYPSALLAGCDGTEAADLLRRAVSGEELLAVAHEGRGVTAVGSAVSGTKIGVLGGASADRFLVSAGEGLFVVDRGAPGLTIHPRRRIDGVLVADLTLDGVFGAQLSAHAGPMLARATAMATLASCAEAVGAMEALERITLGYLRERHQFGAALSTFQVIQHRLAEIHMEGDLSRSLVDAAFARLPADDLLPLASVCKARVAKAAAFVSCQCIQLHGAMGMTDEYPAGAFFKRLLVLESLFGSAAFHARRVMAGSSAHTP